MLVPVVHMVPGRVKHVYVDYTLVAVAFPVVAAAEYRCIDINTGEIFRGSTCHDAVDIFFKKCYKECLCNE